MTTTTSLDTATVLGRARRARATADAAEADQLAAAVEWAGLHEVSDEDLAATFGDTPVLIAGPGAPMIASDAIAEFAAVVGMSTNAGRYYIGQAIELAHRLPKLYHRIQTGTLPAWKGRRIAEVTLDLSPEAAEYVDTQLAPFAHKTNPAQTQRLVDTAIATFMPEYAAERREKAAEGRHISFNHHQVSFAGTTVLWGELDMADALDLDAVISGEAAALKDLGNEDTLDVRRAVAVGNLARGQLSLNLADGFETGASAPSSTNRGRLVEEVAQQPRGWLVEEVVQQPRGRLVEEVAQQPSRNHTPRRDVVLYVHLTPDTDIVTVENAGTQLVTKDQVTAWTGIEGTRVFIRPVIDLNKPMSTEAYVVPDRIREHLVLRDRTCVFPNCTRPARACDADHVEPWDPNHPDRQNTSTDNLASLCRHHHRLKTHSGWSYTILEPGTYLWTSPHGYQFIRDRNGTEIITQNHRTHPAPRPC